MLHSSEKGTLLKNMEKIINHFQTHTKNYYLLKTGLVLVAVIYLLYHTEINTQNIWLIIPFLVAGFYFGKLTCAQGMKERGFWLTLLFFGLLNLLHSTIDGLGFAQFSKTHEITGLLFHEIIRQPTLYVLMWAMLEPFKTSKTIKIFTSLFAVTGIWLIGLGLGRLGIFAALEQSFLHEFISYGIFIFIGDIAHHAYDEFEKIKKL